MKRHDRAASVFWLMVGAYAAIRANRLGLGSLHHPGPGFIFFLCGLGLVILAIVNLAGTFLGKPKKEGDRERPSIWQGIRWQKILLILGILSAYAYFFNLVGFSLSTFLLMIFLYKGVEPTKWWITIVSSLLTVLASYIVFVRWLEVPFPQGFLSS